MRDAQFSVPIPPAIIDKANEYFASLGLDDLPPSVKQSFAQDVYPKYLQRTGKDTPAPLWEPYNKMQKLARASMAFEVFCGGRARSGKTDLLLGLALRDHENSIIFRPEYSQMEALRGAES